jgi:hypothetical protein
VTIASGSPAVSLTSLVGNAIPYGNPITLAWSSNVDTCSASEPTPNSNGQWMFGADYPGRHTSNSGTGCRHTHIGHDLRWRLRLWDGAGAGVRGCHALYHHCFVDVERRETCHPDRASP